MKDLLPIEIKNTTLYIRRSTIIAAYLNNSTTFTDNPYTLSHSLLRDPYKIPFTKIFNLYTKERKVHTKITNIELKEYPIILKTIADFKHSYPEKFV